MQAIDTAWTERLATAGPDREAGLAELGVLLRRRVAGGLRGRPGADEAFAEDVVQDALLKVLDALPTFAGRSRFTTWATTIAMRVALTELRRRRWKDVSINEFLKTGTPPVEPSPGPASRTEAGGLLVDLRRLIDERLTEKQRHVLTAELNGMPQEEIARRLGGNRNAIYKLAHDARKKLRRELEALGYTAADLDAFGSSEQ